MVTASPNSAWRRVEYRSPLCGEFFGAAVFENDRVLGVAWDVDPVAARSRAIGEANERWTLFSPEVGVVVNSSASLGAAAIELGQAARLPDRVLAEDRFRAFRWTSTTQTTWAVAKSGRNGSDILVPLDLSRFRGDKADEVRVRPMSSVGTATAPTLDEALDRALTELIERHVIAVAVRDGVRAGVCGLGPELAPVAASLEAAGLRLDVGILPNPFDLPVAVAAVSARSPKNDPAVPAAAFGSGAGQQHTTAIRSAVLEAIQVLHLGLQLLRRTTSTDKVVSGHDRARAWASGSISRSAGTYFGGQAPPVPIVPVEVRQVLAAAGVAWWYRDLTPQWAEGWRAVRAGAPALGQLLPDERAPIVLAPDDLGRLAINGEAWERVRVHPFV